MPTDVEGVCAKKSNGVRCYDLIPQLFQSRRSQYIYPPQQTHHLPEKPGPSPRAVCAALLRFLEQFAYGRMEKLRVRHPLSHESGQNILSHRAYKLVGLLQALDVETL